MGSTGRAWVQSWGLFQVWGLGFRVQGLGPRVEVGFRDSPICLLETGLSPGVWMSVGGEVVAR